MEGSILECLTETTNPKVLSSCKEGGEGNPQPLNPSKLLEVYIICTDHVRYSSLMLHSVLITPHIWTISSCRPALVVGVELNPIVLNMSTQPVEGGAHLRFEI